MKIILKALLYMATSIALILFSLDWIVWGKYIPQKGNLGFLGYVGVVGVASLFGLLLEGIPFFRRR